MRISICVRVYSGIRNVVQLNIRSDLRATRGPRGELAPNTPVLTGIHKSLLLDKPCGWFPFPCNGTTLDRSPGYVRDPL